jgi:hypothetical protein
LSLELCCEPATPGFQLRVYKMVSSPLDEGGRPAR